MAHLRKGMGVMIAILGTIAGAAVIHLPLPNRFPITLEVPGNQPVQADNGGSTNFFVVAGGGAPSYNEIALEKNVQYFQRTLEFMGWDPAMATILFANGHDGQATIRYLDGLGREQFKVPEIEHLTDAATDRSVQDWLDQYPQTAAGVDSCPAFMYFTGHGLLNEANPNNNDLILWDEERMSVQALATTLDQWPTDIPFVTMMAQCYSGSFANLIYEGGDPEQPVALQTRCGFFATVKTRPSVGCTPMVNEADYRDYSSSFFAGLSGRDRVGNAVESADYDDDGTITFAEAHAFAKVDEETSDWPISTSEAWLQKQADRTQQQRILGQPMEALWNQARPEQQYVITSLTDKLGYSRQDSLAALPMPRERWLGQPQEVLTAYHRRLRMELINVGMEQALRNQGEAAQVAILDKLLACESSTW